MTLETLDKLPLVNFINHELMLGRNLGSPITEDSDLIDASVIDSLSLIQLVTHLEREYKIQIDDHDVNPDNFQTVRSIMALIEKKRKL